MLYQFKISYLKDGVLETHKERERFSTADQAYIHFTKLCDEYDTGPYYYLCSWEESFEMRESCMDCRHFQKSYFGWYVVCNQCDEFSRFESILKEEGATC